MANRTRQVQRTSRRDRALLNRIKNASQRDRAIVDQIKADLERAKHPFREPRQASRRYPDENAGKFLAEYLNALPLSKRVVWLESLGLIQALAEAAKNRDVVTVHRLRMAKRGMKLAYEHLVKTATPASSIKRFELDVHEDGLIVHPVTPRAKAALAVLVLEKNSRIDRVRRCSHCEQWFYARFQHQKFCADPTKRCQWDHYHSPEWRKQNRERNKRHQRGYRDRLFGKRRLEPLAKRGGQSG
jgi:hypothetical protein